VPDNYIHRAVQFAKQGYTQINFDTYTLDWGSEAYQSVSGQNSNNTVRVSDEFLHAVGSDAPWHLTRRTDGAVAKTLPARELWEQIAEAAWQCADPGMQFDTTINDWHTCPTDGRLVPALRRAAATRRSFEVSAALGYDPRDSLASNTSVVAMNLSMANS
jgi:ribonucleoside-diphosphate reductase alpha chain